MSRFLLLTTLAAFGINSVSMAQDRPFPSVPQTLGLEEALELAGQYSPIYRQALNDHGPASWGVRNAVASLFLPDFTASGYVGYSGSGSQNFLTQSFIQPSGTIGSGYSLTLGYRLSGSTLSQPGVARARRAAINADVTSARMALRSAVVNGYLAVLQAQDNVRLAGARLKSAEEAKRLAEARYLIGQTTVLDVRQAEVRKGQTDVALIQAQQDVTVAKLRLFQQIGVAAPYDPAVVSLSDTFPVVEPTWQLPTLLDEADQQNPDLNALRARHNAAVWNERAVKSAWFPTFSLSARWSAYTQHFTDISPVINNALVSAQQSAEANAEQCAYVNANLLNPGAIPLPCPSPTLSAGDSTIIGDGVRSRYPVIGLFDFGQYSREPFSASVSVSFPIFSQFGRALQASEAAAAADDARETARARALQVRTDVSQAYYGVQTAFRTIGIQETNRAAAREGLRLATEQYRVGSGTFLNVLEQQAVTQLAETDYVTAVYAYHRAVVQLETAVGRPLR